MKIKTALKIAIIAGLIFAVVGCNLLPERINKKDAQIAAKEKEIATLKVDFDKKLDGKVTEIQTANAELLKAIKLQIVGASNAFYTQQMLFNTIITPTRTDILFHNYGDEGWAALGHSMPDYDTMLKINDRLKNELDETKTSLADLQKNHEAVMTQNQKLVDNSKILSDKITSLQHEIEGLKSDYSTLVLAKQADLVKLSQEKVALEQQRADDAAAIHAAKMKFSLILGAIALAALAGSIWSPIWKDKCALMAGICGAAAVGIWYITPFIVGIFCAVSGVALVAWAFYKFHIADKTNNAYINFEHELETKNPALYNLVKNDLDAWKTKYIKDKSGNVTTVPDKTITTLVDDKLIATDKK